MTTICEASMRNFTIRKTVAHCGEDGKMGSRTIDVTFDAETLLFSATLPTYVALMTKADAEISGDTANGVIKTYEVMCDEYSRLRLSLDVPTQLWIGIYSTAGQFAQEVFGFTDCVGIGATPVKMLPTGQMMKVLDDGSLAGPCGSKGGAFQPVLIADTPEHRAKVRELAASIQRASSILAGLRLAPNPADYLMAIREDWQPPQPVQIELSLDLPPDEDDL